MIWLCSVEDGLEGQSRREEEQLRIVSWSRWKTVGLNHQGYGGRNEESRGEMWQIFRGLNWLDTCWLDLGLKGEAGVRNASQFSSEWLNGWYCHPPTLTPQGAERWRGADFVGRLWVWLFTSTSNAQLWGHSASNSCIFFLLQEIVSFIEAN